MHFLPNVFVFFLNLFSYAKDSLGVIFNFYFSAFSFAANTAYLAVFLADIFFLATLFFPDLKKSLFFVDCIIHWVVPPLSLLMPFTIFENAANLFSTSEQVGFKMHPLIVNKCFICVLCKEMSKPLFELVYHNLIFQVPSV